MSSLPIDDTRRTAKHAHTIKEELDTAMAYNRTKKLQK